MADISATSPVNYDQMMGIVPENSSQVQGDLALGGLQRAQTGLVGQQTIGAGLQNQKTQILLAQLQKLNSNPQPVNPYPNGGVSSGEHDELLADGNIDAGAIATHAAQKYSGGLDIWSPQELQQLQSAPLWAGLGVPGMEQMVKARHDAELQTRRQMVQLQAGNDFENNMNVANAPPGAAYQMMARTDPQKARWIDQQAEANGWDDNKKDQIVRALESESANQAFIYSGREAEMGKDGIIRDKKTGKPIPNALPEGTSKEQATQLWDEANKVQTIVVNGQETPVKTYKLAGFNSPQEYVAAEAKSFMNQQRQTQQGGTSPPAGSTAIPTPNTGNPTQAIGSGSNPPVPNTIRTTPASSVAPPGAPSRIVQAKLAASAVGGLDDPTINWIANGPKATPVMLGNTGSSKPNDVAVDTGKIYNKAKAQLLSDSKDLVDKSNESMTNITRMDSILNPKDGSSPPILGPGQRQWSSALTFVSHFAPAKMADFLEDQAARSQVFSKMVGSQELLGEVSKLRAQGAQLRMGVNETNLIMNWLVNNPSLSVPAIRQMLSWEKGDVAYDINKGKAGQAWAAAGNDPQKFNYGSVFPRQNMVNTSTQLGTGSGNSMPTRPGQQTSGQPQPRTIVRTGTHNGTKVVQYSDGSIEEAPAK